MRIWNKELVRKSKKSKVCIWSRERNRGREGRVVLVVLVVLVSSRVVLSGGWAGSGRAGRSSGVGDIRGKNTRFTRYAGVTRGVGWGFLSSGFCFVLFCFVCSLFGCWA